MCKISYVILESATVTVKVVDILGTTVKLLSNTHDKPGTYEVKFESEKFPIGKYYYKVFVNSDTSGGEEISSEGILLSSGQFKV